MNKEKTIKTIASIALAYFLLASAFYIPYYDDSFFKRSFEKNGAYEKLGIENTNLLFQNMKEYQDKDYFGYDRYHLLKGFAYNEQEHLRDMKVFIDWLCILYYLAAAIILSCFALSRKFKTNFEIFSLSSYISLGFIFLVGLSAWLNFNLFWQAFHQILFPQGNFVFAHDSLLITLFPEAFFKSFISYFVALTIALSIMLIIIEKIIKLPVEVS